MYIVVVKSGDTSRCKYYYSNKMELPIFHDDNVMVLNSGKTIRTICPGG